MKEKPSLVLVVSEGIVCTRNVCPDKNIALSSSWKQWPENKEKLFDAGQWKYWRIISYFFFNRTLQLQCEVHLKRPKNWKKNTQAKIRIKNIIYLFLNTTLQL